jgi:MFS family permease
MHKATPREHLLLAVLFFLQAHAIALWFVPFSNILKARGLDWMLPWAFGSSALAALFSPMLTGTLADKHLSPALLLRILATAIAGCLCLTFFAIEHRWPAPGILACIQLQHLCAAPAWGLTSQLVLAKLPDPGRQFGPLRAWATLGWLVACLLVSWLLSGDQSTLSGFCSAAAWLCVAGFTFLLHAPAPQASSTPASRKNWRALLGWDAFRLLQDPEHRGLFISAGLLSIPLAAFYPYTPLHLQSFGITGTSAWMAIGQISEFLGMYALAPLLAMAHLRTLFLLGIAAGILRYGLFALDSLSGMVAGIFLHGVCFTLFFIPAQIYIEQRIPAHLRYRAQALLTLLINGFGNLFGYLGCGWLYALSKDASQIRWPLYWGILAAVVTLVGIYFLKTYPAPGASPEQPAEEKEYDSSPA